MYNDDLNSRLYYKNDSYEREVAEHEKSKVLSSTKDFKNMQSINCYMPNFYEYTERFKTFSRMEEEGTKCISFVDGKSYKAFLEAMKSLEFFLLQSKLTTKKISIGRSTLIAMKMISGTT